MDEFTLKQHEKLRKKLDKFIMRPVYAGASLKVFARLMKYAKLNPFQIIWKLFLLRLFGTVRVGAVSFRRIR